MTSEEHEPLYVISVAARLVGTQAHILRYYEKLGLISPRRSQGRFRLYSPNDLERIRRIQRLMDDLGVNLAGVEVIMHMSERLSQMERNMHELEAEAIRLRQLVQAMGGAPDGEGD
ncbi:MAG: MerR family transcriptional regulator [Chloroflexota bacterium]|nr:MAG: MerR family transcriptional regulator [Chloroflexota bacterium]